ncbi:glycosyltransferase family 2 protein [Pedobacter duraquae]|uniref:Glycosyltransferase 2-like domain-containing protein n=1 Tax=Pedobacter duraquae TaxID=425511 RepID=A0A4R6IIZ7_9SPHI|nr:glycosyltransferase family 2 protein [Pedobacter duraquae]TDO21972.1 hypothetical protein CLV32_3081 [Pedobacter duraquae]
MTVSIIIVNYKTCSLVIDAIKSVRLKTLGVTYEIIVVDNNSEDSSERLLYEEFSNEVIYIALTENIGFGRANNKGIEIAIGRNIFLLNPDTLLTNDAVTILSNYLDNNPNVGAVGANLYNEDHSFQPSFSRIYPSIQYELSNLFHLLFFFDRDNINTSENPKNVKTVVGAAMMISKNVLNKVGGFNPEFFMYEEENELCYRIKKSGYQIMNVPEAKVIHLDGKSFAFSEQRTIRRLEGLRVLYRLTYSEFYCDTLKIVEYLTITSRLLLFKLIKNESKIKFWSFMYNNRKW